MSSVWKWPLMRTIAQRATQNFWIELKVDGGRKNPVLIIVLSREDISSCEANLVLARVDLPYVHSKKSLLYFDQACQFVGTYNSAATETPISHIKSYLSELSGIFSSYKLWILDLTSPQSWWIEKRGLQVIELFAALFIRVITGARVYNIGYRSHLLDGQVRS